MESSGPALHENIRECVDQIINYVGGDVRLGMPIGVGKPTLLANEFYRRAKEDSNIHLKILSGLTLMKPGFSSDLERRFMEPLVRRLFDDYPDPAYIPDARQGKLPSNIELIEFFLLPGAFLGVEPVQQNYISSNYTHVARDVTDLGLNVAASMIAKQEINGSLMYSLSSNADAPLDMVWKLQEEKKRGGKVAIVGQVNTNMPFMYGTAALEPENFDFIVDSPEMYHTLYGPPREPVSTVDYFIGLYSSALVRDGGTVQIGIGSLGDSIAYGLQLRQENNNLYKEVLSDIGAMDRYGAEIEKVGTVDTFTDGLYGCTELLTDAFLQLINSGVIKREVYDDEHIQQLIVEGKANGKISMDTLDALLEARAISPRMTEEDFAYLRKFGVLKNELSFSGGVISGPGGESVEADLENSAARDIISKNYLGDSLVGGVLIHSSFFLGPQAFYDTLSGMSEEERMKIQMREISFCNQLYGGEDLKRMQRTEGRFFNTAIMMTLMGAAVSDGLENGQVISGVGGQYNFVSMGHALPDGRSVLLVRGSKERNGELLSDVVWNYGHITVPRHLRDIYVTEYGIALVRGKTDQDTIKAILNVTDSRFQDSLLRRAKDARKIPADYRIPTKYSNNFPERLEKELEQYRKQGFFQPFPYGTELTDEEIVLGKALKGLKEKTSSLKKFKMPSSSELGKIFSPPAAAMPYLERMQLHKPADSKEKIMQKLVLYALATSGAV